MKGYEIFEQKYLKPYKDDGLDTYDIKIGFLDFLREMKSDAEGISRLSSFTVAGLDDVLYMTKAEDRLTMARKIHNILQSAASVLEKKKIQVQIVCKGRLVPGDSLFLEYRGEKLPLAFIFGSTIRNDVRGAHVYTTGFNLST